MLKIITPSRLSRLDFYSGTMFPQGKDRFFIFKRDMSWIFQSSIKLVVLCDFRVAFTKNDNFLSCGNSKHWFALILKYTIVDL